MSEEQTTAGAAAAEPAADSPQENEGFAGTEKVSLTAEELAPETSAEAGDETVAAVAAEPFALEPRPIPAPPRKRRRSRRFR
jgi:hypothetical protein